MNLNLSDHQAVYVTRKKDLNQNIKVSFEGRSYRNYIKEDFQESLINHNWDRFYQAKDPDVAWDIMYQTILDNIEAMCPMKTFRIRQTNEPWMTAEVLEIIKDKDRLLARAKRTGRQGDWEEARRARNIAGQLIDQAKKDFFQNEFEANRGDPKQYWKEISRLLPSRSKYAGDIVLNPGHEEDALWPGNEVSNHMNNFFVNVGKILQVNLVITGISRVILLKNQSPKL